MKNQDGHCTYCWFMLGRKNKGRFNSKTTSGSSITYQGIIPGTIYYMRTHTPSPSCWLIFGRKSTKNGLIWRQNKTKTISSTTCQGTIGIRTHPTSPLQPIFSAKRAEEGKTKGRATRLAVYGTISYEISMRRFPTPSKSWNLDRVACPAGFGGKGLEFRWRHMIYQVPGTYVWRDTVSYTHLTLPTIYSV